jgi:predicted metalloprotease with PDZ domain
VTSYLDNPGSAHVSPEQASWTVNDPPGANGAFSADLWEQGRLIATVLDLAIRDSTAGRRSLDDVMRALVAEHPAPRGFAGADVEHTAGRVCGCSFHGFFTRHARGSALLDFDAALRPLGLRTRVWLQPEVDSAGRPRPDLRVWAYTAPGEQRPRLVVNDPRGAWYRAGLRTGDAVVAMNGVAIESRRAFTTPLRALHTGDRVRLDILRAGRPLTVELQVGGYETTRVTFEDLPQVTPAQRAARERWLVAAP